MKFYYKQNKLHQKKERNTKQKKIYIKSEVFKYVNNTCEVCNSHDAHYHDHHHHHHRVLIQCCIGSSSLALNCYLTTAPAKKKKIIKRTNQDITLFVVFSLQIFFFLKLCVVLLLAEVYCYPTKPMRAFSSSSSLLFRFYCLFLCIISFHFMCFFFVGAAATMVSVE